MSQTFALVCYETKQKIWVGQGWNAMTTFYSGMPEVISKLGRFLEATRGRPLVLICQDTQAEDWEECEEFEDGGGEFCEDEQWKAEQNSSMIQSKFKPLTEDSIVNEQLPDMSEDLASKNQTDAQTQYGRTCSVVLERTELNESEHVALIKAASHDRYLSCTFGSGVYLAANEGNRWAFELLEKLRMSI